MKKLLLFVSGLLVLSLAAACSGAAASSATQSAASSDTAAAAGTPGPDGFRLSSLSQLLIGTLKLEGTGLAVTPEQAQTLLPLWQAVQSLGQSDTTAQAEMDSVEQQIHATLTAEQQAAIDGMSLSGADMQSLMTDLGLSFGSPADGTPVPGSADGSGFPPDFGGGDVPRGGAGGPGGGVVIQGGGPGGDGGVPSFGTGGPQDLSPDQLATLEAGRGSRPSTGMNVPRPLLNALLDLLKQRAG